MAIAEVTKDQERQRALLAELHQLVDRPMRLMVVCGTQNRAILKYGIREKLPDKLELVAGPGCSVCVMPAGHIDAFIKIATQPKVITAACEDLLRVPGSKESLASIASRTRSRRLWRQRIHESAERQVPVVRDLDRFSPVLLTHCTTSPRTVVLDSFPYVSTYVTPRVPSWVTS